MAKKYSYTVLDRRMNPPVQRKIVFWGPDEEVLALRKAEEYHGKGGEIDEIPSRRGRTIVAKHPDEMFK